MGIIWVALGFFVLLIIGIVIGARKIRKSGCDGVLIAISLFIPLVGFILGIVKREQGKERESNGYFIASLFPLVLVAVVLVSLWVATSLVSVHPTTSISDFIKN